MITKKRVSAIGRRKRAVAQVELIPVEPDLEGKIIVNNRDILEYMQFNLRTVAAIQEPFETLSTLSSQKYGAIIKVNGGGIIGQAQAIRLGIARALCKLDQIGVFADAASVKNPSMATPTGGEPFVDAQRSEEVESLKQILKVKNLLTQDSRCKERKKYGLKKARKASQYSKR